MPQCARKNGKDTINTGHDCDTITYTDTGSDNVFINSIGAVRLGDLSQSHLVPVGFDEFGGIICGPHIVQLTKAQPNVFVNSKQIGRKTDDYQGEVLVTGSPNVFANG